MAGIKNKLEKWPNFQRAIKTRMGCSGSKAASPGGSSAQSGIARRNTSAEFDLASSGGYAQSRLSVAMPSTSAAASTLATRDLDHGGVGGGSRRSMSASTTNSIGVLTRCVGDKFTSCDT